MSDSAEMKVRLRGIEDALILKYGINLGDVDDDRVREQITEYEYSDQAIIEDIGDRYALLSLN